MPACVQGTVELDAGQTDIKAGAGWPGTVGELYVIRKVSRLKSATRKSWKFWKARERTTHPMSLSDGSHECRKLHISKD